MRLRIVQTAFMLITLCLFLACGHQGAKSRKSFDDIRDMVMGRTAAEVENLLGAPDSRQTMVLSGERWVWWDYTYLDGMSYPPDRRGKVVHLEIIFERVGDAAGNAKAALSELRAADPLSVSYTLSQPAM